MDEKFFFHWETQVIVITIVFELIMIASIVYVWWGISFKEKLMESIARIAIILVIIGANVSLFTKAIEEYDLKEAYDAKHGIPTTAAPKVFMKYFFVNTVTGEKSGEMMAIATLTPDGN